MASIVSRGQSFRITVTLGRDEDGKLIQKTTTFKPTSTAPTKARKEAEAFAVKFEQEVLNGDLVEAEKITFGEFCKIWEKGWLPAKSPRVQEKYPDILRLHILPTLGHMKLVKIRATHIDKLYQKKLETLAPKTVQDIRTVIQSVMTYALKKGYIKEDPCVRCDNLPAVPMKTGNDLNFFTEDQAKRFLNDALTMEYVFKFKGHKRTLSKTGEEYTVPDYVEKHPIPFQWRVYFNMAIYGGFRREEMCALTWKDIDFKNNVVSINKAAIMTKKNGRIEKDPKTKKGIRDIVMPSGCMKLLEQWKREQAALCLKLGSAWQGHRNGKKDDGSVDSFEDNTVFIQLDTGLPVHLSTPGHKFHEIIDLYNSTVEKEEDKLPHIRPHDLRHTSATLLLAEHMDIETVSRRLGHARASITLDVYGHALPENDRRAADAFEKMFEKNS